MGVTTFAALCGACAAGAPFCAGMVAGKIAIEIASAVLTIILVVGEFIFTGSPLRLIAALGCGSLPDLEFRRFCPARRLGIGRSSLV
jgi:hypothetical protein